MTDYFYEVSKGHGLPHDPFKAIVAPRPIGWISTCDREGRVNLAPYSFFNAAGDDPPMIAFCSGGWKDSVRNIAETGEFVYNLVTRELAEAMSLTAEPVPGGVNEMELAGLAAAPSKLVRPPRVADAPAALECRLTQLFHLRDVDGRETENHLVVGQVVGVHIDSRFLNDGLFDTFAVRPVMRAGYADQYAEIGEKFLMARPDAEEE